MNPELLTAFLTGALCLPLGVGIGLLIRKGWRRKHVTPDDCEPTRIQLNADGTWNTFD